MVKLKKTAVIVAGGTGSRMLSGTPKQFLLLCGKPMLMHSLEAFDRAFPGMALVVALPENCFDLWNRLCTQFDFSLPHQLTAGGETRFHSVKNALAYLDGEGLVAIHDGARPLVSETLIRQCFLEAAAHGNAVPVIALTDSVRQISGETNQSVDRTLFRIVQTPQVFRADLIKNAYQQEYREQFTDDAMVIESMGESIHLADGDPVNIKITHPSDLAAAEALLRIH
jgi:2-C-methyl-D-erythritol 4-phosphate cytidylyltransferase